MLFFVSCFVAKGFEPERDPVLEGMGNRGCPKRGSGLRGKVPYPALRTKEEKRRFSLDKFGSNFEAKIFN
jgi:hypothetical protein